MFTRVSTTQKLLLRTLKPALLSSSFYNTSIYHKPKSYINEFNKPKFTGETERIIVEEKITTTEEVSADYGLGHYMTNVYKATGGGLLASLAIAKMLAMGGFAANPLFFLGGAAISLGGIFTFNRSQPEITTKLINGHKIPYAQQPPARMASYAAIFAGTGMSIAPLIAMADMMSPTIVPMSMALTAFTFGGVSAYAYNRPLGSFSKMGGVLTAGVFGLIGMSLVSLGSYLVMGPNPLSYALMRVEPYLALGIFSGLVAYDTHQAVERYKFGDFDHLSSAVQIYLDVVNLLTSFIRIIMQFFRSD